MRMPPRGSAVLILRGCEADRKPRRRTRAGEAGQTDESPRRSSALPGARGPPLIVRGMSVVRSLVLFILAAFAEIGGAWLVWQVVREQREVAWVGAGVAALGAYGVVATLQDPPAIRAHPCCLWRHFPARSHGGFSSTGPARPLR